MYFVRIKEKSGFVNDARITMSCSKCIYQIRPTDPRRFMTGVKQTYSRDYKIAIDTLVIGCQVWDTLFLLFLLTQFCMFRTYPSEGVR